MERLLSDHRQAHASPHCDDPCAYGGADCPPLIDEDKCQPVDCKVSDWTARSGCNPLTKTRTRSRSLITPASYGGAACPSLVETQVCTPTDCIVSSWSPFASCDNSGTGKASGKERRFRTVLQQPDGGAACPPLMEERPAPKVDCVVSDWSDWGVCDPVLFVRVHNRSVISEAKNGGKCCPALQGSQPCCPKRVDCKVGEWSDYPPCDAASNTQTRTRDVTQAAGPGGRTCPDLQQTRSCKPSVDCQVGDWSDWEAAPRASCGALERARLSLRGRVKAPSVRHSRTHRAALRWTAP